MIRKIEPVTIASIGASLRKRSYRKRPWIIAAGLILALSGLVYAAYFQSFETDTTDWTGATRVSTTTHGVLRNWEPSTQKIKILAHLLLRAGVVTARRFP
jgi:peptidoglycan/LPS O-acetylase OafA/YrhL